MMTGKKKKTVTSCDICMYYSYDDEYDCYTCEIDLDEDEMWRFMSDHDYACPYFRMGNEYTIVHKQI